MGMRAKGIVTLAGMLPTLRCIFLIVLVTERARMKVSALMATVLLAGIATGAQAADTLAKIAETGKITLAYRESSVPFSYLDGNKPIGFSVELSNAVVEAVK